MRNVVVLLRLDWELSWTWKTDQSYCLALRCLGHCLLACFFLLNQTPWICFHQLVLASSFLFECSIWINSMYLYYWRRRYHLSYLLLPLWLVGYFLLAFFQIDLVSSSWFSISWTHDFYLSHFPWYWDIGN